MATNLHDYPLLRGAQASTLEAPGKGVSAVIQSRLSTLLGERRISITELARGAGINYQAAHSLYHDKTRRFDADVLDGVCRFLGIQVGDLLVHIPDTEGEDA